MAALKLRLAGHSDQPVLKFQTTNAEAYELYLKGRYFWNQRGIGLRKALHYFELALIEDPDYALVAIYVSCFFDHVPLMLLWTIVHTVT
jgi:hypothetical protein